MTNPQPALLEAIVEEDNVNLFAWCLIWEGFAKPEVKHYLGVNLSSGSMAHVHKGYGRWAVDEPGWLKMGEHVLHAVKNGTFQLNEILNGSLALSKELHAQSDAVLSLTPKQLADAKPAQLVDWFDSLANPLVELQFFGLAPVVSDFHHFSLSTELTHAAQRRLRGSSVRQSPGELVAFLSTPTRDLTAQHARLALLTLATQKLNGNLPSSALETHARQFGWLDYGYNGPAKTAEDVAREVAVVGAEFNSSPAALEAEFHRLQLLPLHTRARQVALENELGFSEVERRLFDTARTFMYLKALRVETRNHVHYALDAILAEGARRAGRSLVEMRALVPWEARVFLTSGCSPAALPVRLTERVGDSVSVFDGKRIDVLDAPEGLTLWKSRVSNAVVAPTAHSDKLVGHTASPGIARGKVRVIHRLTDLPAFETGEVLVSKTTNPEYVPAMKKAVAFVTETGGVTCHAAIVAREMDKPCVVGVRHCTTTLQNGDLVEVDADAGVVRRVSQP